MFLEAAACGVPAVAGRSGGSHEAVVDGETGYVVGPRDVGAVRGALRRLCDDPDEREAMARVAGPARWGSSRTTASSRGCADRPG